MAIIDTLNEYSFVERFKEVRSDNFSSNALVSLFHYYEDISEGIGEHIEFDPVAICCDWTEYETHKEALEAYGLETIQELYDNTVVLPVIENTEILLVQNY